MANKLPRSHRGHRAKSSHSSSVWS